ncbi:MAG TPA: oligosaccharide flippase family protein [Steroidobacteraceae bacterium]|jgi:O-antigen/teichoic acid export membrane protein
MKATLSFENKSPVRAMLGKLAGIKGELVWVIVGQATAAVAALAGVRIMTGLLSPVAYGELALGMTVALLIVSSLFGPLTNGINRFYAPAIERGEVGAYLRAARRLALSATGIVVLVAITMTSGMLIIGRTRWIPLGLVSLVFAVLTGYNGILSGVQNAARQRSIVALHQGIESWTRVGFAAAVVFWLGATSTVSILGYTAGIIVVLASQYVFFRRIRGIPCTASPQVDWHKQILQYSWPFYTWCLFTWAQLSSDRWALALFADARDVGLYAALFQLGNNPIAMASTMAMQLLAPIFYQRAGDGNDSQRNAHVNRLGWRFTMLTLALTGIAVCGGALLHTQIFQILVAKKYASVSPLLPYMLLASGIFVASQMIELSLMSQMKAKMLIVAKIASALLGITLNFAGAFLYGVKGVVVAGVLTSAFYYLWMAALSRYVTARHEIER